MAMKGQKKIDKQFRFPIESLELIDKLSIKYFDSSKNKFSRTIEEAIKRTANDMGIFQDTIIIRNSDDLFLLYQNTANENGKVMTVVETAKQTGLAENTIHRYRTDLTERKKLKAVSTSAMYLVEGGI